ncbi:MAG: hypothetical protein J5659_06485 [Clostridia bacterium]|nr:hypothetical protein [Clostridia bacterium]
MANLHQKFFLGANSADGFVSHFSDSYIPGSWQAYIIKGGPGSGKSSFMKYIAAKATDKGYTVILTPCSSDPDSLDGVIIEELKTVILDGTAPHIVEPRLPGACENIINLGQFWDSEKLFDNAETIMKTAEQNSRLHKTVSAYLSAAGELIFDNLKLSRICTDRARTIRFAKRLAKKYLPERQNGKGEEFIRFIGGTTPKGIVAFSKTVTDFYKNIIVIDDKYGAAANEIMKYLRGAAKQKGYDIITLKNPFLPYELTDHILIPELSLAFVTENEFIKFDVDTRRIHSRRFADNKALKAYRARMLFNRRVSRELLLGAVSNLKRAKEVHDELEKYYINAMDFKSLTEFAMGFAKEIL